MTHGRLYIVYDASGEPLGVLIASGDYMARLEAFNRWNRDAVIAWDRASDRLRSDALRFMTCLPRDFKECVS